MTLQALEYEKEGYKDLDEFWQYTKERIKNKKLVSFFKELVKEKDQK